MRIKFLLGANKYNELVFGEIEVAIRNSRKELSASFDVVRPFNIEDIDKEELVENMLEEFEKSGLYDLCVDYECSPQDLASIYSKDLEFTDIVDCSLYSEEIEVNKNTWMFESSSCGQCDTKDDMVEYTNKKAYEKLIDLWEKYHLKEITSDIEKEVNEVITELEKVEEEEWIKNYIKETFY